MIVDKRVFLEAVRYSGQLGPHVGFNVTTRLRQMSNVTRKSRALRITDIKGGR